MKNKLIKIVITVIIILIGCYFVSTFVLPKYLTWQICRMLKDTPLLYKVPEEELNNVIDKDYISTLKQNNLTTFEISLPKEFYLYRSKNNTFGFKRTEGNILNGVILISCKPDGFLAQPKNLNGEAEEVLRKSRIKNDYDLFSRAIYARKDNIRNLSDAVFLHLKYLIFGHFGTEGNVKIYKYFNDKQKGYIRVNVLKAVSVFDCDIFDNSGNYFYLRINTKAPTLSLGQVCTIISTIKKL